MSNTFPNGQVLPTSGSSSSSSEGQIHPTSSSSLQSAPIDKSDAILAYLEKLDQSNKASGHDNPPSTLPSAHNRVTGSAPGLVVPHKGVGAPTRENSSVTLPLQSLVGAAASNFTVYQGLHHGLKHPESSSTQAQFNSNDTLSNVNVLRQNQEISHSVNRVLAFYKKQSRVEATQSKRAQKKNW